MKKKLETIDIATDHNIIKEDVEKALYGDNTHHIHLFGKVMTFVSLFAGYILWVLNIDSYGERMIIMVFGLILLVVMLQTLLLPAFVKKKKVILNS